MGDFKWNYRGLKKNLDCRTVGQKRSLIDQGHPNLSIQRQCELLELSRSSYYYVPCVESPLNLKLMRLIDEEHLNYSFYGYPRMCLHLSKKTGQNLNEKRIYRLMKKNIVIYKQRRDYLCKLLNLHFINIAKWNIPSGGLAIWLEFQSKISLVKLAEEAEKNDLFLPKTILYQDKNTCAIRFGFGHLTKEELEIVIQKLKSAYTKLIV